MTSHARSLTTLSIVSGLSLCLVGCGVEPGADDEAASPTEIESALTRSATLDATAATTKTTATATTTVTKTVPTTTATLTQVSTSGSDFERAHPWIVNVSGGLACHGVLIHPQWVLTAAHCIGSFPGTVSFTRTDPTTGATVNDSRSVDLNGPKRGMFVHPEFVLDSGFGQPKNDIALIKLQTPFVIDRNLQTVGLPRGAAIAGRVGTIVTNNHGPALPGGSVAVVKAPQLASCASPTGFFCIDPPAGSLCKGDSGSGFVEVLDGRAQVVGITSNISGGDECIGAGGQAQMTDVFAFRDFILSTMGMSAEQVAGQVRLRWSGSASAGTMSLTCLSTGGAPIEVPMNAPGGEIGMNCDDARVFCQPASGTNLTGFSVSSFTSGGGLLGSQALPYLPAFTAAFADPGSTFQTYTCAQSNLTVNLQANVNGQLVAAP